MELAGGRASRSVWPRGGTGDEFFVELSDEILTLTIEYADGRACEFSAEWHPTNSGVIAGWTEGSVNTCGPVSPVFVDGKTLRGGTKDLGGLKFEGVKIW
jgi:hypothetical protein